MVERTLTTLWLFAWTMSTAVLSLGGNLDLEQNCILSFVVPRDKMKSSCELDEKVNRRISAIEMKVNIYKQEVADLRLQLDKERQLNAEKMDQLKRSMSQEEDNDEFSIRLEKRLSLLEKTLEQLPADLGVSSSGKAKRPYGVDEKASPNSPDGGSLNSPSTVKAFIQLELNGMFENFTKKLEAYVKEQVLFYNQIFRMLPVSPNKVYTTPTTTTTPTKGQTPQEGIGQSGAAKDKATLPPTIKMEKATSPVPSDANRVDGQVVGVTLAEISGKTEVGTTVAAINESETVDYHTVITDTNRSEIVLVEDGSEANDTFSEAGEKPLNKKTTELAKKEVDSDISAARIGAKSNDSERSNSTDSKTKKELGEDENEEDKAWKDNMIGDQHDRHVDTERLRNEITAILYSPLSEVFSVIEKKAAALEEKLRLQDDKSQLAVRDLQGKLKDIDQSTKSSISQLESLVQGLQDSFIKMDKLHPLETIVNEIKKNISVDPLSKAELDEQGKKLKKLERLLSVYQQSLEHYRNETKQEYRDLREAAEKNATTVKSYCKSGQDNVTMAVNILINKLNNTYRDKFKEVHDAIQVNEDNVLLCQIDLNSFEKKFNGKMKNDKEMEELQGAVNELASKQRDFKKKLDSVESQQLSMVQVVNSTAKEIFDLKTEMKLDVLDEWLPMTFDYDISKTDCHGEQYVKKIKYSSAKIVGVVLCTPKRYKIFLSSSLHSKFLNIGDSQGMGEDHCEFVGAPEKSQVKLSPFRAVFPAADGYIRNMWGEEPKLALVGSLRPSPDWYECGLSIP